MDVSIFHKEPTRLDFFEHMAAQSMANWAALHLLKIPTDAFNLYDFLKEQPIDDPMQQVYRDMTRFYIDIMKDPGGYQQHLTEVMKTIKVHSQNVLLEGRWDPVVTMMDQTIDVLNQIYKEECINERT